MPETNETTTPETPQPETAKSEPVKTETARPETVKPVLLTIDDDADVLRAVERDLRRQYGAGYRVMRADSGPTALDALKQLKVRNDPVALLLADQRMPRMTGVEFLEAAREIYPQAKRVLLTAYADTEAAIQAINAVKVDYYLMKPWDPPQENLYPILDDLLDEWKGAYRPPFAGIRILGHRWSPDSHRIKEFLARNRVPYEWLDIETMPTDGETRRLVEAIDPASASLPLVLLEDGTRMDKPTNADLAEKVGLRTRAELPFYDLVIVGGGPAGLAAAVYGASEGLHTVMIEREAPGGQAGMSSRIENYLGFPTGLSGNELARRAVMQAERFGVEILAPQEAKSVRIEDSYRIVTLADDSEISCHALLISTGVAYRKTDIPSVERLAGAGVYYGAAMTEAISCKDEQVFVVGGANSAGQAAMYFSRYASSVTMLVRGNSLAASMSQYLIDQISQMPNITVRTCSRVLEAHGENNLEALTIVSETPEGAEGSEAGAGRPETVPASALFIFIGATPHTDWLDGVVARDDNGFIYSGPDLTQDEKRSRAWPLDRDPFLLETSVPGIFVAGDVRHGSVKRVASGVGEGSIAVQFIHQYLSKLSAS